MKRMKSRDELFWQAFRLEGRNWDKERLCPKDERRAIRIKDIFKRYLLNISRHFGHGDHYEFMSERESKIRILKEVYAKYFKHDYYWISNCGHVLTDRLTLEEAKEVYKFHSKESRRVIHIHHQTCETF